MPYIPLENEQDEKEHIVVDKYYYNIFDSFVVSVEFVVCIAIIVQQASM